MSRTGSSITVVGPEGPAGEAGPAGPAGPAASLDGLAVSNAARTSVMLIEDFTSAFNRGPIILAGTATAITYGNNAAPLNSGAVFGVAQLNSNSVNANCKTVLYSNGHGNDFSYGVLVESVFALKRSGNADCHIFCGGHSTGSSVAGDMAASYSNWAGVYISAGSLDVNCGIKNGGALTAGSTLGTITHDAWYRIRTVYTNTGAEFFLYDNAGTLIGSDTLVSTVPNTVSPLFGATSPSVTGEYAYIDYVCFGTGIESPMPR